MTKAQLIYELLKARASAANPKFVASSVVPKFVASYAGATVVQLKLDANTLNRYLRDDNFVLSDSIAFLHERGLEDVFAFDESATLVTGKVLADSLAVGDVATVVLMIQRQHADNVRLVDSPSLYTSVSRLSSFAVTDRVAVARSTTLRNTFSADDLVVINASKGLEDSATFTDSIYRTVQYSRDMTDTLSMSDSVIARLVTNSSVLNVSAINQYTINQ